MLEGTYTHLATTSAGSGLPGPASGLRRTRAGGFHVEDALTLEEIELRGAAECLLPVDALFAGRPSLLYKGRKDGEGAAQWRGREARCALRGRVPSVFAKPRVLLEP